MDGISEDDKFAITRDAAYAMPVQAIYENLGRRVSLEVIRGIISNYADQIGSLQTSIIEGTGYETDTMRYSYVLKRLRLAEVLEATILHASETQAPKDFAKVAKDLIPLWLKTTEGIVSAEPSSGSGTITDRLILERIGRADVGERDKVMGVITDARRRLAEGQTVDISDVRQAVVADA